MFQPVIYSFRRNMTRHFQTIEGMCSLWRAILVGCSHHIFTILVAVMFGLSKSHSPLTPHGCSGWHPQQIRCWNCHNVPSERSSISLRVVFHPHLSAQQCIVDGKEANSANQKKRLISMGTRNSRKMREKINHIEDKLGYIMCTYSRTKKYFLWVIPTMTYILTFYLAFIWHFFWHSIWHSMWRSMSSCTRGWGPTVPTEIWSSQLAQRLNTTIVLPVVPHKAVAEVSKIGNL